jgi:hypothetical protein
LQVAGFFVIAMAQTHVGFDFVYDPLLLLLCSIAHLNVAFPEEE